ncbi:MAG: hypothetical protein ACREH5_04655 [Candidatus Omnitrophota bacterium]
MKRKLWMLTLLFLMSGWVWAAGEGQAGCVLHDESGYEDTPAAETGKAAEDLQGTVKA